MALSHLQQNDNICTHPCYNPASWHLPLTDFSLSTCDERLNYFAPFIVFNTTLSDFPVVAASSDIREAIDVERSLLSSLQDCALKGRSKALFRGQTFQGYEIIYLAQFSPMRLPDTGRTHSMLVTFTDVSEFVSLLWQQEAETLDREGEGLWVAIANDVRPEARTGRRDSHSDHYDLWFATASELIDSKRSGENEASDSEDVWMSVARDEMSEGRADTSTTRTSPEPSSWHRSFSKLKPQAHGLLSSLRQISAMVTPRARSHPFFNAFLRRFEKQDVDVIILRRSIVDERYHEILAVSTSVYESGLGMSDILRPTLQKAMRNLAENLQQGRQFQAIVRWGTGQVKKHMYCVPMYYEGRLFWVCRVVWA